MASERRKSVLDGGPSSSMDILSAKFKERSEKKDFKKKEKEKSKKVVEDDHRKKLEEVETTINADQIFICLLL